MVESVYPGTLDVMYTDNVDKNVVSSYRSIYNRLQVRGKHEDTLLWKHHRFKETMADPHYWPFVRGIHGDQRIPITKGQ